MNVEAHISPNTHYGPDGEMTEPQKLIVRGGLTNTVWIEIGGHSVEVIAHHLADAVKRVRPN